MVLSLKQTSEYKFMPLTGVPKCLYNLCTQDLQFTFRGKHMKERVLERMQKLIGLKGVYFYCTQFLHGEYTVISVHRN